MQEQVTPPAPKRFFRETTGAGAKVGTVLLLLLLSFCLLGAFILHTVASVFEQRGLQRMIQSVLQTDKVRTEVADVLRETFPEDVITDAQLDAIVNDDAIMGAAGRYIYEAIHFESNGSESFYDHMLSVLDDPASASLYNEALDHFTDALGIGDEDYRAAMEAIAEEQQIALPEGTTDKLALTTAILHEFVGENQDLLPVLPTGSLQFSTSPDPLGDIQRAVAPFETPRFILYNLLFLAILYGILLLINRSYRKPFLHCCIPYFVIGVLLFLAYGLVSMHFPFEAGLGSGAAIIIDLAGGVLLHSGLLAIGFAVPLLIVFIILTLVHKSRASRAGTPAAEVRQPEQIAL